MFAHERIRIEALETALMIVMEENYGKGWQKLHATDPAGALAMAQTVLAKNTDSPTCAYHLAWKGQCTKDTHGECDCPECQGLCECEEGR